MVSPESHIRNVQEHWRVRVHGVVQGVGFRPFLYGLAEDLHVRGWARNTSEGVVLELEGPVDRLRRFKSAIENEAPPLARVVDVSSERLQLASTPLTGFTIRESRKDASRTLVSPDTATCEACRLETTTEGERRFGYAFTNCTHCGPRFTIVTDLPYDRESTSMESFAMCPDCAAEYGDTSDRRFHAQPIACPACGPEIVYDDRVGMQAIRSAAKAILDGHIIAVKGLGGFHIACLATDTEAVARLRESKERRHKPFALMVPSVDVAREIGIVSDESERELTSTAAPIVLVPKLKGRMSELIAPQNGELGLMLPYTSLHHLLMAEVDAPVVMTSGNPNGEPLCIGNEEARERLASFVDGFLTHDRPIVRPCDDSVVRVGNAHEAGQFIRRSRGYVPLPVPMPTELQVPVLAAGGDIKNVAGIGEGQSMFLTQHIGDLGRPASRKLLYRTIVDFERMFKLSPEAVVCDLHPGYASTQFAETFARERGLEIVRVQHHHAHIASCLAENGHTEAAVGLAFDGTGYGTDGNIWGGEILAVDRGSCTRESHIEYLPLPGGDAAGRHPHRIAIAGLTEIIDDDSVDRLFSSVESGERALLRRMVSGSTNIVQTSSLGRLFDAVSAVLGLVDEVTFEGQAAIALEHLASECDEDVSGYPFSEEGGEIRVREMLGSIALDVLNGEQRPRIARRFHRTVADFGVAVATRIRSERGIDTVALSGGCWANRLLCAMTIPELEHAGFRVLTHRTVPANDGGLAYGQAAVFAQMK